MYESRPDRIGNSYQSLIARYQGVIVPFGASRYAWHMNIQDNSKLVVIVDDDESVQNAVRDLMEADGLSARCFGSAEQFLKSGLHHQAGCLIADIRMPGMSGLELQAKLKAEQSRIPIIFITAHGDGEMRMQAMCEGAVEFLTKPFDEEVLLGTVRAALEG
jgi:FixJ family two-component response regulator